MADSSALIQEPSVANATAEVDAESVGTGPQGKALRRERLELAGAALAEIARVMNSAPAGSEYALVVRIIPGGTQPISVTSLPLPAGAALEAGNLATLVAKDFATQTTLALIKAKTDNLDVTLSTRTKPADVQAVSGPLTDAQLRASLVPVTTGDLTDGQLRASPVPVSGPLTDGQLRATAVPVSGPLTDAQLRASTVPVSAAIAADVVGVDADPGYVAGQVGKNLTQTPDGRLRVLGAGLVQDAEPSYIDGAIRGVSLTTGGRLRVATVTESDNFTPWGNPETFASSMPTYEPLAWG
jgi:hypothetical protein